MSIGSRLRKERERLNMKQEDFATACGVRRRAQSSYESDTRSPDANYLEAAAKIGVDISYVIYGKLGSSETALRLSVLEDVYFAINSELGSTVENAVTLLNHAQLAAHPNINELYDKFDKESELPKIVKVYLRNCPKFISDNSHDTVTVDTNLLETILEHIETILLDKKINLQSKKKALAVSMLYRAFKASGKVDLKMIEETLILASQSAA
ncbi:helix-turn-helix domain-containing protein [Nitrosomonas sp.]|uniref:helix-turn-helix domain-containing protein n=1 Tax=Nitrosomonas sp. TaxID=42353 RepID=UPI0032EAC6AF